MTTFPSRESLERRGLTTVPITKKEAFSGKYHWLASYVHEPGDDRLGMIGLPKLAIVPAQRELWILLPQ